MADDRLLGGSLCTGAGGLDLGLERALGIRWLWHAEPDETCSRVLEAHWPGVPNLGDVFTVDWNEIERVDLVAAGFPCPDYSLAGKRVGMEGDSGQVWFGVAAALRALRPSYVVLENVSGILNAPGVDLDAGESAFGVVSADLADLGYDTVWSRLRASDLGAPHERLRWFCVASLADTERAGVDANGSLRRGAPVGDRPGRPAPPGLPAGTQAGLLRAAHAEQDGGRAAADANGAGREEQRGAIAVRTQQRPTERRGREAWLGDAHSVEWGVYEDAVRRWEEAFGEPAPAPTDELGRLSPAFPEWMLGYPSGWFDIPGLSRSKTLRAIGNSVQVQCAERVGGWMVELLGSGLLAKPRG